MMADEEQQNDRIELQVDSLTLASKQPRLDAYLAENLKGLSRTRIQKLIEEHLVLVDTLAVKTSFRLKGGETVTVEIPPLEPLDVIAEAIPLSILYEDEYLAVVNKPAGMVTHPGAGIYSGTLVNALLHHMRGTLSGIGGTIRPGIVHRLDKDTSGLLVVAKEDFSHRHLAEQIREKSASRIYIALVKGHPANSAGTIDAPIGRHPTKRKQMAVVEGGRSAVSHYQVLEEFAQCTLVRVKLETGRTHQIRVHMSHIGHPVIGDLIYNHNPVTVAPTRAKLGLTGQALHAAQLSFVHPKKLSLLEFEAPLPDDFLIALESLRAGK
jgi:23S rRNA pseudouridine1911/1915/1917 synthase